MAPTLQTRTLLEPIKTDGFSARGFVSARVTLQNHLAARHSQKELLREFSGTECTRIV